MRAARSLAIAASVGSPHSETSEAASAVVAAAIAVVQGIAASNRRHWSSAAGCERTMRTSSRGTSFGPTRQCRIGRTVSPVIERGDS